MERRRVRRSLRIEPAGLREALALNDRWRRLEHRRTAADAGTVAAIEIAHAAADEMIRRLFDPKAATKLTRLTNEQMNGSVKKGKSA